jgi:hypothetical protein
VTQVMTKPTEQRPFDITRDRALIKTGTHFWCQGHLGARPIEERSPDPRYCRSCYDFLSQEAMISHIKADWVPKATNKDIGGIAIGKAHDAPKTSRAPSVKGDTILIQRPIPPADRQPIMSTPKPPTPVMVKKRRGPKQKKLPVGMIKRWEKKGLGSKRIAARLKEQGVEVSYKTIQRILNGQRVMEI